MSSQILNFGEATLRQGEIQRYKASQAGTVTLPEKITRKAIIGVQDEGVDDVSFRLEDNILRNTERRMEDLAATFEFDPSKVFTANSSFELVAFPGSITFHLNRDILSGWQLTQPLPVTLEFDEDGTYIVSDDIFLLYGAGATYYEAIKDYLLHLVDYYGLLKRQAAKDDPQTQALFEYLRQYLQPAN